MRNGNGNGKGIADISYTERASAKKGLRRQIKISNE